MEGKMGKGRWGKGRTGVVGNELGDPGLIARGDSGTLSLEIREGDLGVA